MIRLKHLLREIKDSDLDRLLTKIKNKQFRFFAAGDNGRVYEIDGEDKLLKITKEMDEFEVASIIVGRYSEFTTFIPVYYVTDEQAEGFPDMAYIMSKADNLTPGHVQALDRFIDAFKTYAYDEGGEVTIFDYLDAEGGRNHDVKLINFLRALQADIRKMNILDFELDLDFKTDNIMIWNGNLVMIDW